MNIDKLKKIDNYLERLYGITNAVRELYIKLNENPNERNRYLEYIKIAKDVEDNIYKEIGKDLLTSDSFINRLHYKIRQTNYSEDAKSDITKRIFEYITELEYINPFTSLEDDFDDYTIENNAIIKSQAVIEYATIRINLMDKLLEETTDKKNRTIILKERNSTIYQFKFLEKYINEPIELQKTPGREKCIIFGHNKKDTDIIYKNSIAEIINSSIPILLNYTDSLLQNPLNVTFFKLQLIDFEAALIMANEEEVKEILAGYKKLEKTNEYIKDMDEEISIAKKSILKTITKYIEKEKKKQ